MTDRELLEMAAKAAGIVALRWGVDSPERQTSGEGQFIGATWNPLLDDGDALRLAVKLNLMIDIMSEARRTDVLGAGVKEYVRQLHGSDSGASTRRAIVMAAAEIGKTL